MTVVPSIASVAGIETTLIRSVPSRWKRSSSATRDLDVEVAGRRAGLAGVAGAGDPQPLAVLDPGRDLDLAGPLAGGAAGAAALLARRLGDLAGAAADVAGDRADHLPERRAASTWRSWPAPPQRSQVVIGVPGSAPLPWQCSQAPTASKRDLAPHAARATSASSISTATPMSPPPAGPRAGRSRSVAAAAEEGLEDVVDRAEAGAARVEAAGAQALVAVGVVGAAPLGVGEDLVGLGRLLELLLGLGVVVVDVGVQLAGEAAEGLLDLGLAGVPADAEHLVVVARHRRLSSS